MQKKKKKLLTGNVLILAPFVVLVKLQFWT